MASPPKRPPSSKEDSKPSSSSEDRSLDEMFTEELHRRLQKLAHAKRWAHPGAALNTMTLVQEVYVKFKKSSHLEWHDEAHFINIAGRAMCQLLTDAAKQRAAESNGGKMLFVTFGTQIGGDPVVLDWLIFEEILQKLEELSPRQASIAKCLLVVGMTVEETATALKVAKTTVERDWRAAKAWLTVMMRPAKGR